LFFNAKSFSDSIYCSMQIARCNYLGEEYSLAISNINDILSFTGLTDSIRKDLYNICGLSYLKLNQPKVALLYFERQWGTPSSLFFSGIAYMKLYDWTKARHKFFQLKNSEDLILRSSSSDLVTTTLAGEKLPEKNPIVAGILSAVIPGAGYLYTGHFQTAFTSLVFNAFLLGASYELNKKGLKLTGGLTFLFSLGWYIGNIYGSVNSVHRDNEATKNNFINNAINEYEFLLK
ncbi:MAG: hypothetical protein KJ666_13525, partial [Bacteroidetes bacterium]|nr:hypothetical protein [Bacteroidota bacterium]